MTKTKRYLSFLWIIVCLIPLNAQDIPDKPDSWIHDQAGVLSAGQYRDLVNTLGQFEKRTSNQIFVAIFEKMPEHTYLEDFTVKLFTKWGPGRGAEDNGLLIVIFIQDRKMRIETGYGVEDVITDAQAGTVIRERMAPHFRQGDYYGGIKSALEVLMPAMEGKYKIPVKSSGKKTRNGIGGLITLIILFVIFSRFFGGGGGIGSRKRGGFLGPFILGSMLGSMGSRGGGGFSSGGFGGGGGFSGGFGGMSGGGGASGGW